MFVAIERVICINYIKNTVDYLNKVIIGYKNYQLKSTTL